MITISETCPYKYAIERIARSFGVVHASEELEKALIASAKADSKLKACLIVFDALKDLTGLAPPWGIFTGVRPVRYIRENRKAVKDWRIREDKLALIDEIIKVQKDVLESVPKNAFHLYIGIPFCPSRCAYCSFVSQAGISQANLIPRYVELLIKELAFIGERVRAKGLTPYTVYIGGGTPTSLPLSEQVKLYDAVKAHFDLSNVIEYTVEAGRPETINKGVLTAISEVSESSDVTRISINPQTINNETLKLIGRNHDWEAVLTAYELARNSGFKNINMDLIAGLPNESEEDFLRSVRAVIALSPDNITVHGFARKRGANMGNASVSNNLELDKSAYTLLKEAGYFPYYLYRLRDSQGDNIGYTRDKTKLSAYNICMMDESSMVIAAGAGGATRIITDFSNNSMQKHYNHKYAHDYIRDFDNLNSKKGELL